MKLQGLMRDYSVAKGISFPEIWNNIYREFRDRYHIDLKLRAENAEVLAKHKIAKLDVCERLAKIEELYAVTFDLLKN